MIFSVISLAPDLGKGDRAQAIKYGPPFIDIAAKINYEEMLRLTGWDIIEKIDLTAQFLESNEIILKLEQDNKDDLVNVISDEDYQMRIEKYINQIDIIHRGIMRRDVYAVQPV